MIGLALTRYEFRGRGALNLLIFIPMTAPEIILGASLLTLWVCLGVAARLLHHPGRPRHVQHQLRGGDRPGATRRLEPIARGGWRWTSYADERTTFRKVTFPLIFPGILAAALLAFALSIDDYVITLFFAGRTATFPLWVFGVSRLGIPPEVNVLGTLIFLVAFALHRGPALEPAAASRRDGRRVGSTVTRMIDRRA